MAKPKEPRNDSPFVFGNAKLSKTIAILNICPASLCPSAMLGLCQLKDVSTCYARQEEKVWANTCIPSRLAMTEYWDRNVPWTIARDLVQLNETKRTKVTALRINECGDFRHAGDVEKAEMLARYLAKKGIKTYCYTARSDLDFSDCRELTVNGSGWMAHNRFQVAYRLDREDGKPIAIDKNDDPVACSHVCPGKCGPCSLCSEKAGNTIAVKLH